MRSSVFGLLSATIAVAAHGQASGKWPPDSLVNTRVIPRATPVMNVVGMMRNYSAALGVRCQHCHVGEEGRPLAEFDFQSDEKRTKVVARQMMLMVAEINRRVDSLPGRGANGLQVTCATCHRGARRPLPLSALVVETAESAGADSALRAYDALRKEFYGRDTYDFGESSLNIAAFRLGRGKKFDDAIAVLDANEKMFPASSGLAVFRGNILLMRGDTLLAVAAFREAVKRNPANEEAKGRLVEIGSRK